MDSDERSRTQGTPHSAKDAEMHTGQRQETEQLNDYRCGDLGGMTPRDDSRSRSSTDPDGSGGLDQTRMGPLISIEGHRETGGLATRR